MNLKLPPAILPVILSMFLGLFLGAVILTIKKGPRQANLFLGFLLISSILPSIDIILYYTELYKRLSFLVMIGYPFIYIVPQLLFFYVKSLTEKNFVFKKKDFLHFIPFFIMYFYYLPDVYITAFTDKYFVIQGLFEKTNSIYQFFENIQIRKNVLTILFSLILYWFYTFKAAALIREYRQKVKEHFSSMDKVGLSWLRFIIGLFLFSLAAMSVAYVLMLLGVCYGDVYMIISWGYSVLIFFIGFKGLSQVDVLFRESQGTKKSQEPPAAVEDEDFLRLERLLAEEKLYRNPELSLDMLCGKLEISRFNLTRLINLKGGCNFYSLINRFRLDEVKAALSDPSNSKESILTIALASGFNSKSTFNRLFKEITGLSPSTYRREAAKG